MNKKLFLKDVFICSLGAYGGPEAHYAVFSDQMVHKKKYLSDEELLDFMALCSVLPGPTSTQTIVSIGYKVGGPILALLTMLVWALPVIMVMIFLSFFIFSIQDKIGDKNFLEYIGPMAVGFIVVAAYRISKKVLHNKLTVILWMLSALVTYFIRTPWIYPTVLVLGGWLSTLYKKETTSSEKIKMKPPWIYMLVFLGIGIGTWALVQVSSHKLLILFEQFYRYGYLVFGGGQVVIPVMYSELVEVYNYISHQDFLTGYGLVQGLPGPMFSFSAYAGSMASQNTSTVYQVLGGLISSIGIFLPGLLLIYFVYPIWDTLKKSRLLQHSLQGIRAVSGGLIVASAIIMLEKSGLSSMNLIVMTLTAIGLYTRKIPSPLFVVASLILGFYI